MRFVLHHLPHLLCYLSSNILCLPYFYVFVMVHNGIIQVIYVVSLIVIFYLIKFLVHLIGLVTMSYCRSCTNRWFSNISCSKSNRLFSWSYLYSLSFSSLCMSWSLLWTISIA
jgi:hypothetical protein